MTFPFTAPTGFAPVAPADAMAALTDGAAPTTGSGAPGSAAGRVAPPSYPRGLKRGVDLALALMMLPLLAGLILVLWWLVRRDGGPGFFGHARVGAGGRTFRCWKLRTMVVDAEARLAEHLARCPEAAAEWARDHKLSEDPRVTAVGRFLRRTSLDELPQVWNVLRGEMSFVGPRPVTAAELDRYGRDAWVFRQPPGVTGLWQVSGRNDLSYDERVRLDVAYCRSQSLGGDLRILLLTAGAVLGRTGK